MLQLNRHLDRKFSVTLDSPASIVPAALQARLVFIAPAIVALAAFTLALSETLPDEGDSVKFSFLGKVFGIGHPTGYPTYTLLLGLFAHLPFGTLTTRAAVVSSIAGALSVGLTALITYSLLDSAAHSELKRQGIPSKGWTADPMTFRLVAIGTAVALAASATFWSQAIIAEVYTTHLAILAAAIYFFLRWKRLGGTNNFLLAVGMVALGATHHGLMLTAVPAFAIFSLLVGPRTVFSRKTLLAMLAMGAAALSTYLYFFQRTAAGAVYQEYQVRTLSDFLMYVTGRDWQPSMFSGALDPIERLRYYGKLLMEDVGVIGMLLAGAGIWRLRRQSASLVMLLAIAIGDIVFSLNYDIPDIRVYFIPSFFVAIVLAGVGLASVVQIAPQIKLRKGVAAVLAIATTVYLFAGTAARQKDVEFDTAELNRFVAGLQPGSYVFMPGSYLWYERFAFELLGNDIHRNDDVWLVNDWQTSTLQRALAGQAVDTSPLIGTPTRKITRVYIAPERPELQEIGFVPDGELTYGRYQFVWKDLPLQ